PLTSASPLRSGGGSSGVGGSVCHEGCSTDLPETSRASAPLAPHRAKPVRACRARRREILSSKGFIEPSYQCEYGRLAVSRCGTVASLDNRMTPCAFPAT